MWVEIDMRLNRAGWVIELSVRTAMGWHSFGISAGEGQSGFLLSPLLTDPDSFGRLFLEGGIDPRMEVRALSIVQSDLARRLYEPAIGVRLYKVLRRRAQAPM